MEQTLAIVDQADAKKSLLAQPVFIRISRHRVRLMRSLQPLFWLEQPVFPELRPDRRMFQEMLLIPAAGALAFTGLKLRKQRHYRQLQARQNALAMQYKALLNLPERLPEQLPDFQQRIAIVAEPLPATAFEKLREAALRHASIERSYFPTHKKGGTVAYEDLHQIAPEIVTFYQSDYLRQLCSAVIGEPVAVTPMNDQSSCSLLFYDRPRDHIGWHYDYNFYSGRHFTVLLPLINRHLQQDRLSSAQLVIQQDDQEAVISTPPNTLIMFEGARVFHKVTRLEENELRVILSMTFCTRPQASLLKGTIRRFKDIAYFGVRALWS